MGNSFSKAIYTFKTKILNPKLSVLHKKAEATLQEDDLEGYNFGRRDDLFKYARMHSKFYKEKYADLELHQGLETQEDFLEIPPLTRAELRENFEDIQVNHVKRIKTRKAKTSGSTGPPITVLHDSRNPETPIRWRILKWWGVEPWENQAFIYRFKKPLLTQLWNDLMWWPTRRVFLAAANLNDKKLHKFINRFNRIKPTLLQGYVDVVFEFALYLLDNNIKIHPPKMVWVTSAPLFEEQRAIMEKAFGAPVCDQYGNTEILLIAAECPEQKGLHIMQDTVHIEFVDENNKPVPPNTTGRILLTDLTNYAFPLIRYEIGDEGKYLDYQCSCGKNLPLMENVRGRQAFVLKTPTGLSIRGEHLMAMFSGYIKAFKEIQLVQNKDYSVCINYVPRYEGKGQDEVQQMAQLVERRARSEINVTSKEIDKIKIVGRKTPLIISLLD